MQIAPLPPHETARLARLRSLGILDTLPQQAYDDISALAMAICKTPMAYIGFIDADREWLKARNGLDVVEAPRDITLCAHAILEPDRVMVVEDTLQDPRFSDNPLVTGDMGLRFYAGAPIVTSDGMAVGTVCVIDRARRQLQSATEATTRYVIEQPGRSILLAAATGAALATAFFMSSRSRK